MGVHVVQSRVVSDTIRYQFYAEPLISVNVYGFVPFLQTQLFFPCVYITRKLHRSYRIREKDPILFLKTALLREKRA